MEIVIVIFALVGFAVWLFAVVSWVLAIANRKPEVSLSSLLLSGMKAFDGDNFTEVGQRHQRRFMLGFALFFLFALLGIAAGIVLTEAGAS